MAKEKIKQADKAGVEQFLAENEISEFEVDRLIAFAEGAEQNEILEILKLKQKSIAQNKPDIFKSMRQNLHGKLGDEEDDYSSFFQANTAKKTNLTHEEIVKLREQQLSIIDKKYFKGDEWGNCNLSQVIEEKKFEDLKKIFKLTDLSDVDVLKEIALAMCNKDYKAEQNIDHNVAVNIFGEVIDQLDIIGESTADIMESYNLA